MATAATITFAVSGTLMVALVFFKRWELARGAVFLGAVRARLDRAVLASIAALQRWTPRLDALFIKKVGTRIIYGSALFFLRFVQYLEGQLLSVIRLINGQRTLARRDTNSAFLRSVAEQKKVNKTQRARIKREADKAIQ